MCVLVQKTFNLFIFFFFRFGIVIGLANPVIIELEPDLRLREGETFETEVALATLDGEAKRNTGWLLIEIFIETFLFFVNCQL